MNKRKRNKKIKLDRYTKDLIWINEEVKKICARISKSFEQTLNQFDPEDGDTTFKAYIEISKRPDHLQSSQRSCYALTGRLVPA